MEALHIDRADVVGHSLGSMTAAALAGFCAERVDRLALLSRAIRFPKEAIDWLWDNVPNLSHPLDPNSDFMLAWFSNPTPVEDDFLTRDRAERASVTAPVWLASSRRSPCWIGVSSPCA